MLGKVAQRYTGHSATGNTVGTVNFPITKCALWDHTPIGSNVNIHLAYYRNVEIHVEKKVLQLAHRYAQDSRSDRYHCLLTGSVISETDGEGTRIHLDRFDPGRDDLGSFSPTTLVPGDISIPCIMQKKEENLPSQTHVSDYMTVVKMLQHRCNASDKVELSNFFVLKCTSKYTTKYAEVSINIEFDLVTMATCLKAMPINPVPIMPTALSKNLMGPMNMSNLQGEPKMGYLTMDHTRKLLLILQSDPKVQTLPLVGIWVTGIRYIYDPYVWCSCLRYLHNNSIQERACTAPDPFLVALFSPLHSKPEFYECLTDDKTSKLRFELNACQEAVDLMQSVQYRQDDCLVFDLQKVESGAKLQAFSSATDVQAIPEKDKPQAQKPLTELSVNIEDLMPRSSPFPHQTKAPVVQPQVPEVSFLFDDDSCVKKQAPRLPLTYSVFKQNNDENKAPVVKNKQNAGHPSAGNRVPLKPVNREFTSNAYMSQNIKQSPQDRENILKERVPETLRNIPESGPKRENALDEVPEGPSSPSAYSVISTESYPGSQGKVPSSHGMRMRSPNMMPQTSQAGPYGMRFTSPPYMGPRQPYDQYYHPGMRPNNTGSPPGMYAMPPRGGYPARGQMMRHPYGPYMPRPYPGQYPQGLRGPYYPPAQGARYYGPGQAPYRPAQYRSSPPQMQPQGNPHSPNSYPTSSSGQSPQSLAQNVFPSHSPTMTSQSTQPSQMMPAQSKGPINSQSAPVLGTSTHQVSAMTSYSSSHYSSASSATLTPSTSSTVKLSTAEPKPAENIASPFNQNKPHGAIPPMTPSTGEPSLPVASPNTAQETTTEKPEEKLLQVNGVAVTPDVYKLLMWQDTQLKELQSQLQKLLEKQEEKIKENPGQQSVLDSSVDCYKSILKKFQSTPSKKSCSIATNTSLYVLSPKRSKLKKDLSITQIDSDSGEKVIPVEPDTILAEHTPLGLSPTHTDEEDESNETESSTNNDSIPFSMHMTLQERTIESSMSDMIVDLPCYDTGSGGSGPNSQDIQSVSMYAKHDQIPVMPCDMGGEQMVPGKEDNSREYYENLIGNIKHLLNNLPEGSQQDTPEGSVNCTIVDHEPVRDVAKATLDHLKNMGIYDEKEDKVNDSFIANQTLLNMETGVLHKINYVSMMFDDNNETDISMEVNSLAMKYLSDDQLSQMAKLSVNSRAQRAARSSKNILERVMHNATADKSSNVTLYGMAATDMSFATKKYMERYGLLDAGKTGSDTLGLDGAVNDDTCANMTILKQDYNLRVPPLLWHNTSLDEEPSKLEPSECSQKPTRDEKPKQDFVPIFGPSNPTPAERILSIDNPQRDDYYKDDTGMIFKDHAFSMNSEYTSCSFHEETCTEDEFCQDCMPRSRSDTMPLETPRRLGKERRFSDGNLRLHDSCPDFSDNDFSDSPRSSTRSPLVMSAIQDGSTEIFGNTTADTATTTDREVRKILEKPLGSFETDTVFSTETEKHDETVPGDGFRVFDRPAREVRREPLPQHVEAMRAEESLSETILDIRRLKQLPKLL